MKLQNTVITTSLLFILGGCGVTTQKELSVCDNSEVKNVKTAPITPISPRTPNHGSYRDLNNDINSSDNSDKSNSVKTAPITPRTPNQGLYSVSNVASDKSDNSENPKIPSIDNFAGEKKEANPLLTKPKIAKIKIQSYIDTDGDYHEPTIVHMVIRESKFVDNKKYFSINEE